MDQWLDFWQRGQAGTPTTWADFNGGQANTGLQGQFYARNPSVAWGRIVSALAPNGDFNAPLAQFARNNYSQIYSDFLNAATQNPMLQATDYFGQQAGRMHQRFGMQSAAQRGERPDAAFAGRPNNWG